MAESSKPLTCKARYVFDLALSQGYGAHQAEELADLVAGGCDVRGAEDVLHLCSAVAGARPLAAHYIRDKTPLDSVKADLRAAIGAGNHVPASFPVALAIGALGRDIHGGPTRAQ